MLGKFWDKFWNKNFLNNLHASAQLWTIQNVKCFYTDSQINIAWIQVQYVCKNPKKPLLFLGLWCLRHVTPIGQWEQGISLHVRVCVSPISLRELEGGQRGNWRKEKCVDLLHFLRFRIRRISLLPLPAQRWWMALIERVAGSSRTDFFWQHHQLFPLCIFLRNYGERPRNSNKTLTFLSRVLATSGIRTFRRQHDDWHNVVPFSCKVMILLPSQKSVAVKILLFGSVQKIYSCSQIFYAVIVG